MNNLQNKQFFLTGELEQMKREEAEERIRAAGGSISETLTENTDFLIYGNNNGMELVQALDLNIQTLNEQGFIELLDGCWKQPKKDRFWDMINFFVIVGTIVFVCLLIVIDKILPFRSVHRTIRGIFRLAEKFSLKLMGIHNSESVLFPEQVTQ